MSEGCYAYKYVFCKKEALKTLFTIGAKDESAANYTLLLEIGRDQLNVGHFNKATQSLDHIQYHQWDEFTAADDLKSFLDNQQGKTFERVVVSSAFPQALLTPTRFFNNNYNLLDTLYDLPAQQYFHDSIPEWQLAIVYSIPQDIHTVLQSHFANMQVLHAYTPAIKLYNGSTAENQISIHFTSQYFSVLVKKAQHLQLVQTYSYKTGLDVVYYLLKICYEFGIPQADAHLVLSGLLEKNSAMFKELMNYFLHINFAQAPQITLATDDHPTYFFSSLYNLAACVS